jgi:hypothetical protein
MYVTSMEYSTVYMPEQQTSRRIEIRKTERIENVQIRAPRGPLAQICSDPKCRSRPKPNIGPLAQICSDPKCRSRPKPNM